MNIKDKICSRFNRAALTYDQNCTLQNMVCQKSIQLLLRYQNNFDNIVDLACGTGESTFHLTQHIDFKKCYAVDFAERLLAIAKNKISHDLKIDWIHADFDNPIFAANSLDLVFCNMGLQWSSDFSKTISLWKQRLNANGIFLFSIPLSGNFPEIQEPFKPSLLNHQQVINILLENRWRLLENKVKFLEVKFNNPMEALRSLKASGTNYNKLNTGYSKGLSVMKLDQIFLNQNSQKLTYKIGIYLARNTG